MGQKGRIRKLIEFIAKRRAQCAPRTKQSRGTHSATEDLLLQLAAVITAASKEHTEKLATLAEAQIRTAEKINRIRRRQNGEWRR